MPSVGWGVGFSGTTQIWYQSGDLLQNQKSAQCEVNGLFQENPYLCSGRVKGSINPGRRGLNLKKSSSWGDPYQLNVTHKRSLNLTKVKIFQLYLSFLIFFYFYILTILQTQLLPELYNTRSNHKLIVSHTKYVTNNCVEKHNQDFFIGTIEVINNKYMYSHFPFTPRSDKCKIFHVLTENENT